MFFNTRMYLFSTLECVNTFFNTRMYLSPTLVCVNPFFQYSSVLISNTCPGWYPFPMLAYIEFLPSSVIISFLNTRMFWFPILVRINPFSNTRLYWAPTLIFIYLFLILVCIGRQHSSVFIHFSILVCVISFSHTCLYWVPTLIYVYTLFNTHLY